jgi:peptidyl-prolyl cis-trans isomerase C
MTRIARTIALLATLLLPWLVACSEEPGGSGETGAGQPEEAASADNATETAENEPPDVVARVGDQKISFHELNTMINSSPIVGLSIPEPGSPERDVVRITLLDKMISANLLYLDALQQGLDQDPQYQQDMKGFRDGILANLYRSKYLIGDIDVTDQDVQDFYKNRIVDGTEFTDELKMGIKATIRKDRVKARSTVIRESLRKGHEAVINVTDLDPSDDQVRSDTDIMAELDGVPITWGEARPALQRAHTLQSVQARIDALEKIIDTRLMTMKAREVGLEQDPTFQTRYNEFRKTRLINHHRERLLTSWEPTEQEMRDFYEAHKEEIIVPEVRKVQMLVVKTEQEAAALKQKIEDNELTFHQAVAEYSIIPDAKKTLGQIGWVTEGTGFPELDEVTFLLEAGEIGGPVKAPDGWHLVRVLDQRDARYKNFGDHATQKEVRKRYLDDRLDQYVIGLREGPFQVEIDDEKLSKLSQQEVDWYQQMLNKAQKSPDEVMEEIKKLQK